MNLEVSRNKVFVFDLDDTLYKEIDFVKSGFKSIVCKLLSDINIDIYNIMLEKYFDGADVFEYVLSEYNIAHVAKSDLLAHYREHIPKIKIPLSTKNLLIELKNRSYSLGIITDGRLLTQRNKIKALGLEDFFDDVIISEEFGSSKPSKENFLFFENKYHYKSFTYFGDNVEKDFLAPNYLGWDTVCLLDDGQNIHKQNMTLDEKYLPKKKINSFSEITISSNE